MLYGEDEGIIGEYVSFTKVFSEQQKLHGLTETAVRETIRICKDRNILKEYLESREKEVFDIMFALFDEEQIMRAHDNTVFNRGMAQGIAQGMAQGIAQGMTQGIAQGIERGVIKSVLDFVKDGIITMEDAIKRTGMTEEELLEFNYSSND